MSKLALLGGQPVRTKPWPNWPVFDGGEESSLLEVLRSGKWWHLSLEKGSEAAGTASGQSSSKVAEFERALPERACQEAVWLEHRQLLGSRDDMDDIVAAVEKIYDQRGELLIME